MVRTSVYSVLIAGNMLGGCAAPATSPRHHSMRRLSNHGPIEVLNRAESAMAQLGLGLDRRDDRAGELVSRPFDDTTRLGRGQAPEAPGIYAGQRRVARVRVEQSKDSSDLLLFCRVEVQEQTTQSLRMLSLEQGTTDVPNETPIQREAATTPVQNTVWQTIRRDPAAERAILEAILSPARD